MKDKNTAGILALLFGAFGVHKFYLNQPSSGAIYLIFCWTMIPAVISLIEGISYLSMSQQSFDSKFNGPMLPTHWVPAILPPAQQQPQNIVVNVAPTSTSGPIADVATQIKTLFELKQQGALTDEEFEAQKKKLLSS